MRGAHWILAITALLAFNMTYAVEVYRWLDKDGKVHYSDLPPPPTAKNPELRNLGKNAVEVDKETFSTRDAAKKNPVTLYANNCGPACDGARQLLAKRGIPFTSKNPESSPADADALKKLIGGLEVPVLVVGSNTPIKGFEAGAWGAALDEAGYSKTPLTTSQAKSKAQRDAKHEAAAPGKSESKTAEPEN